MSLLRHGNITCVPSFHNRLQFAREVRRAFQEVLPDVVAVELPDIYTSELLRALERLPRLTLLCLGQNSYTVRYFPIVPNDSLIEGLRLARENQLPLALIDLAVRDLRPPESLFVPPDDEAIPHLGLEAYYEAVLPHLPRRDPRGPDQRREEHMAARLLQLSEQYERILFVCGMQHWEPIKILLNQRRSKFHTHQLEYPDPPFLARLSARARPALLEEIPWLVWHYELARRFGLNYAREGLLRQLLLEAREAPALAEEHFSLRDLHNALRYAARLARTDARVSPDLYNLLLACKQTLGDDYALEVLERAVAYPYEDDASLPEIDWDPARDSWLLEKRSIQLQRRLPPPVASPRGRDWIPLKIERKRTESLPPNYQAHWFFFGFYSHIPEDLILEGFIDRLADRLASQVEVRESQIEEFSGSLLDGLAMRETIRAWHLDKLYVRHDQLRQTAIGAWVLFFDRTLSAERYPWMMSLAGEHHNESDILFYASDPAQHPLTRDIIRGQYGALLAFKPALADKLDDDLLDVDEDLRAEHLIRLAISYSPRPGVLCLSADPPAAHLYAFAASRGKELYHLPLARISERNLRRIQRFHLLSRRSVREIADDYI